MSVRSKCLLRKKLSAIDERHDLYNIIYYNANTLRGALHILFEQMSKQAHDTTTTNVINQTAIVH